MSHYHHLTIEERESLWEMRHEGKSIREIGRALGRSPATICRELKRNSDQGEYRPSRAEEKYRKRRKKCGAKKLLVKNKELAETVRELIGDQQWSPEQVVNRLELEGNIRISLNTIYRALKSGILEPKGQRRKQKGRYPLERNLRQKNRPNGGKRGKTMFHDAPTIHERPQAANDKSEFGHLEGDTVYCKKEKTWFVTLVDRKSLFLWTACCRSKYEEDMTNTMTDLLSSLPEGLCKSVTLDRGSEFLCYKKVSANLGDLPFFFADPMSPWQRGLNENTNGLLRQYVPKNSYKVPFSPELLVQFTNKLNLRPRKSLGWRTPFEVLFGKVLHST